MKRQTMRRLWGAAMLACAAVGGWSAGELWEARPLPAPAWEEPAQPDDWPEPPSLDQFDIPDGWGPAVPDAPAPAPQQASDGEAPTWRA